MRPFTAVVCVALTAAPLAAAAVAGGTLDFTLRTAQGPTMLHPHPPAGGVGDTFVSSLRLVNAGTTQFGKGKHAQVGMMEFTYTVRKECTSFGPKCAATADFDTVSMLPGGTVVADGSDLSIATATITIPVVSGTGRYAGVRGTVSISPTSTKLSVYRLTLP